MGVVSGPATRGVMVVTGAAAVVQDVTNDGGTAVRAEADVSEPAAVRSLFYAAARLGR